MWHHPKYYKELRKRNKSDQTISNSQATADDSVRSGPGLKPQAVDLKINLKRVRKQYTSDKHQAASDNQTRTSSGSATSKPQATSDKLQAQNNKPQASSLK